MKIIDLLMLSGAKRKAHRVRTAVVIVMSALMFAPLFFVTFPYAGLEETARRFRDVGFNDHYFVSVIPAEIYKSYTQNNDELVKQLVAEGTKKGKTADEVNQDPNFQSELNFRSVQRFSQIRRDGFVKAKSLIEKQGSAVAFYQRTSVIPQGLTLWPKDTKADELTTRLEKAAAEAAKTGSPNLDMGGQDSSTLDYVMIGSLPEGYFKEVMAKGQSLTYDRNRPIPIIISMPMAEKVTGLTLNGKSGADKIAVGKTIIEKAVGSELRFCYRSSASEQQLQEVIMYNQRVKNDKDPASVPIPLVGCKDFDQAVLQKAGIASAPTNAAAPASLFPARQSMRDTRTLEFRVVGVQASSRSLGGSGFELSDLLASALIDFNYQERELVVPEAAVQDVRLKIPSSETDGVALVGDPMELIVDARDEASALAIVKAGNTGGVSITQPTLGDIYLAVPFGNIAVLLSQVRYFTTAIVWWVIGVTAVLATIIVLLNVGKVVGDSRREIAIFRAIGARRLDIVSVYVVYGVRLGIDAAILALVLAAPLAWFMNTQLVDGLTRAIISSLGAYDTTAVASLFAVQPVYIAVVVGLMVASGLLGALVPSLAAVRKHMLKQLREE